MGERLGGESTEIADAAELSSSIWNDDLPWSDGPEQPTEPNQVPITSEASVSYSDPDWS
jgi:hypothetical protein